MKLAWILAFALVAGCASLENLNQRIGGPSADRTFNAPIARVKPAFVSTLSQMGMSISSVETRGGLEVLKARKAGRSAEVEFERLGHASTRVRVAMNAGTSYDAAATSKVIQQAEKILSSS